MVQNISAVQEAHHVTGTHSWLLNSDVMGGFALCSDAGLASRLRDIRFYGGAILDPNSAWLLRRSVQTFEIRLERQRTTLTTMHKFLSSHAAVERVYVPEVDGRQLTAYGGILFFHLAKPLHDRMQKSARWG